MPLPLWIPEVLDGFGIEFSFVFYTLLVLKYYSIIWGISLVLILGGVIYWINSEWENVMRMVLKLEELLYGPYEARIWTNSYMVRLIGTLVLFTMAAALFAGLLYIGEKWAGAGLTEGNLMVDRGDPN